MANEPEIDLRNKFGIAAAMRQAWVDSKAGDPRLRHEEGGFIVENPDRTLSVVRWQSGEGSRIIVPPLEDDNRYNGMKVIAAFHTHPNPPIDERGRHWDQAPGKSDIRWHRQQALGGYVISEQYVYEIQPDGSVSILGLSHEVLPI